MNKLIKNLNDLDFFVDADIKWIDEIFSEKTGIINAILERFELKRYNFKMFQSLTCNAKIIFDLDREISSGGLGVSKDRKNAFLACIGESIERYCLSYYKEGKLLFSKFQTLPKSKRIEDFQIYTNQQYKRNKIFLNPRTKAIYWEKIYCIFNRKKYIYWPASLIYMPFKNESVAEISSTGVSAHKNIKKCIIGGILEIIERDAIMINFLRNLNPHEINLNTITDKNKELIRLIRRGYKIKIYRLYSDIDIPIFMGLIWRQGKNGIHYGIGASAGLSSEMAIEKTLKECLFTYFYGRYLLKQKPKNKRQIDALFKHFLYYQGKNFKKLLSLMSVSKSINYDKIIISEKELLRYFKKNKIKVFFKELTTPDVNNKKIKVVRVIIPGFLDLNKKYNLTKLGSKRLWDVPKKLNLKSNKFITKEPHPFP